MANKEFDLVVFGATSFVGKILCEYLVNEYTEPNFTWAVAARSQAKLDDLKSALGKGGEDLPAIVADSFDEAALRGMCERTEVIISTVGPYALYGETLVRVCAETGTDYCDLTGEAQWIRRMISAHEATAQASGARIVHCCGFDSIPSDLGVKFLQQQAMQAFGGLCRRVRMRVKVMQGGASGGTIASGINIYKEAAADPRLREELKDYYSLCPAGHHFSARQHTVAMEFDEDFQSWVAPFIMAAINTRVVLRSNALLASAYGDDFRYDEGTLTGDGKAGKKRARRLVRGSGLATVVMAVPPLRWIATRFLPKPGEGPSPQQQREGHYDLRFLGDTDEGDRIAIKVTGDRDPGYGSTAKMLAHAAISLHRDVDKGEVAGGFRTPATVFGDRLFERLEDHAGIKFEVLAVTPAAQTADAEI